MNVLPEIGKKGIYTFHEPFVVYNTLEQYSCKGMVYLNDISLYNKDIKTLIYEKHNILDTYASDLASNTLIIVLETATGVTLYIPFRYIATLPKNDGIPYTGVALSIDIGAMPVNQDYTTVIAAIQEAVQCNLGVTCNIIPVETTPVSLLDNTQHLLIKNVRAQVINNNENSITNYVLLSNNYNLTIIKLNALETYVKTCMCRNSYTNDANLYFTMQSFE